MTPPLKSLPVAVIGAARSGFAAAAHLLARGLPVKVYEAGPAVGARTCATGVMSASSPRGATALTLPRGHYSAVAAGKRRWPKIFRQGRNWSAPIWNPSRERRSWRPCFKPMPASRRSRGKGSTKSSVTAGKRAPSCWRSHQRKAFAATWRAR